MLSLLFFFIVVAYALRRYEKTAGLGSLALSALAMSLAFITRSDIRLWCYGYGEHSGENSICFTAL